MKILLVEDEPKSRVGVCKMIATHTNHEVQAAENGKEGIEKARLYKPDLIISDIRMPGMSGLEMIGKIRQMGEKTAVIFLTGYSEFEYAHQALKLQAADYVLKPVDVQSLLETLNRVENRMVQKKKEEVSAEQMLWEYVNGSKKKRDNLKKSLEDRMGINSQMQISLLYISPGEITREMINELMFHTRAILESLCMEGYYTVPLTQEKGFLLLLTDTEKNRYLKKILETRVVKQILETADILCSYAVVRGIEEIPTGISHLKELIICGFHMPLGRIIDEDTKKSITYEEKEYPLQLEQKIQKEIWKQDREKIQKIGDMFVEEVIKSRLRPETIREYTIRFAAGIRKTAMEKKQTEEDSCYIMSNMLRCNTSKELIWQFEKILRTAFGGFKRVDITENDIILKVIAFIRENYARDISLSEAAERCHISVEYLSRLFQQETGVKFTSFLQNFRISMAKRLLAADNRKVYEVAEAVGYHDQKYFVFVFKKLCGMTPSEYRKERGV